MLKLAVQPRDIKEKPEAIRAKGLVPAIFYGPKESSAPISLDAINFEKIWKQAGETTIVTLQGAGSDKDALIHAVDFHPVTGVILHADFYVIEAGKKLHVSVPIEFIGLAPAEKEGHIIVKSIHEVHIEVAPSELPQHFEVDLSTLVNVGDHITVADIKLPTSAELKMDAHETICSVVEAKEEPVEEVAAPVEGEATTPEAGAAAEGTPENA